MSACGNLECSASSGIHEGLTFGSGELDDLGFWEKPCALCARAHERVHPEDGLCWPFASAEAAKRAGFRSRSARGWASSITA